MTKVAKPISATNESCWKMRIEANKLPSHMQTLSLAVPEASAVSALSIGGWFESFGFRWLGSCVCGVKDYLNGEF